jgi:hypothetical protein
MIRISLLSIMISVPLFGLGVVHNLSWGESMSGFCYDEVGGNEFCFNNEEDCNKSQQGNQMAESNCYKEDSSLVPIESSSNP